MNKTQTLNKAIQEFERLTGLSLDIDQENLSNPEDTLQRIRILCKAYTEANNRDDVLKRWITGEMDDEEFLSFADRTHINDKEHRCLYLVSLKHDLYPEVITLLKNLLSDSTSWILPCHKNQLILVCHFPAKKHVHIKEKAYEILDMLNTELMEQAVIACDEMTEELRQLPLSFRRAQLTLKVGSVFYPDRTICLYTEMGLGNLLNDLSPEVCREYIRTSLGEDYLTVDSPVFRSDILQTANCFLKNDLNIAETARQLHIHRNTLLYRLEQIQNETGLDIRRFECAMTYRLCAMILLYLKTL